MILIFLIPCSCPQQYLSILICSSSPQCQTLSGETDVPSTWFLFSCDLKQVAKFLGRSWKFQPNSALVLLLETFLDSFNFNHSMPMGLGDEYNLICDLIHISHEWELVLEGISSSFWVISPAHIQLFSYSTGT